MGKRVTYFVSVKHLLTWIAAVLMIGSMGLRIAYFCGEGAEAKTVLFVLPMLAGLFFSWILLLDGKEHFYRSTIPVALLAVHFYLLLTQHDYPTRYLALNAVVLAVYVAAWRVCSVGRFASKTWLILIHLAALAFVVYDRREALMASDWLTALQELSDLAAMVSILVGLFAIRPHHDLKYHPTWGDRIDGRRVRTLSPMSVVETYFMVHRNESTNFVRDEVEISAIEKYVREKRKEGLTNFGINHVFIAAYVRCVAKYPAVNRFLSGQRVYSRGDEIQYCMTVKKEMTLESPDTCIKLHLNPADTVYDVYRKMDEEVQKVKSTSELDSGFDRVVQAFTKLPGLLFKFIVWLLKLLDYFGLLPKFLLEVSPFHGSVFFTSMGSLGIPAIVHHLYDFGNLPVFVAFGCKFKRNELETDGSVVTRKYVDITYNLDERICDGFYYAAVLKYMRRLLAHPERLDDPPEKVEQDID